MPDPTLSLRFIPPFLVTSETYYVVTTDLKGNYTYANSLVINTFSFVYPHYIGQPFEITVHPDDLERCREAAAACMMQPDKCVKVEMRKANVAETTSTLWTQWEFWLLRETDGTPIGILCIGNDITQAKQTLEELQRLRDQYKAMLDSKTEGIVLLDPDQHILAFNRAAEEAVFAQTQKRLVEGHSFAQFVVAGTEGKFRAGVAAALDGRPHTLTEQVPVHHPEGLAWFEITFHPARSEDGRVFGVTCSFRDINAHKTTEEQVNLLSMVATRTSNAVVLTDANRNIIWANAGFTRITGYTLEEVKGKNPGRVLQYAETERETILDMRRHLRAGLPYRCEIQNRGKFGQTYWLDIEIQPLFDKSQTLTGFMAVESDITAHKVAEAKIREQNERLRQIAFEQSHILRKPVSSILGLCEVIRHELRHQKHPKLEQYIALLQQAAEETDHVVHTIVEKTQEIRP